MTSMAILKIELSLGEIPNTLKAFRENRGKAFNQLVTEVRDSFENAVNTLMQSEISLFLGENDQEDNKRNGYQPDREYVLKGIGRITVKIPRDRKGKFKSNVIPSNERIDPRIKEDISVLHVAGISIRTLSMISQRILGVEVCKDTVSDSLQLLAPSAQKWLSRTITGDYWCLYVDGTNFYVQRKGSTKKEPSLVVLGVDRSNRRSILAIEPGTKDDVTCWKTVFNSLKERGLDAKAVRLGVMDGLPGLEKLFKEEFPQAVTQRCWAHALRNATAKCSERSRNEFLTAAHKVMYANVENEAREAFGALKAAMGSNERRAVLCIEKDLDSLLSFFKFGQELWPALRTTNSIETINRQFKRRTKAMDTTGENTLEVGCQKQA